MSFAASSTAATSALAGGEDREEIVPEATPADAKVPDAADPDAKQPAAGSAGAAAPPSEAAN